MAKPMNFAFMCKTRLSSNNLSVAVIGAGPAGLSAAGYLLCRGYDVDVYDKMPLPGGLMVFAIPSWRIPKDNVLEGVGVLEELGARFMGKTIISISNEPPHIEGSEFVEKIVSLEQLLDEYDYILLTTGTWKSNIPGIPGADSRRVYSALEYLYKHRLYELKLRKTRPRFGKKIVVIGGGYSAIDAVEQALDSGAEAYLVYRRTVREAPAGLYEFKRMETMGANVIELASPVEVIVERGVARGVKFQKMRLGPPDETGRPKPIPIPGSEFVIDADAVVFATGERATPPVSPEKKELLKKLGIELTRRNTIVVDEHMRTGNPRIYAAGDVVNGPTKIGPAIRSGLAAARSLDLRAREEIRVKARIRG